MALFFLYRSSLLAAWGTDEEGDIPVGYIACRQVIIIKIGEKSARQYKNS
jgi:hypothetical protein